MADIFSKKKRSEIMSKIRSSSELERAFIKLIARTVRGTGYKYRRNYKSVIGHPDMAFPANKVAIFIDGDFWHGYNFDARKSKLPKKYWIPKIERNIRRDKEVNKQLKKSGWRVIRIWEHQVKKNPDKVATKVLKKLNSCLINV